MVLDSGTTLHNRYYIIEIRAKGGMGVVYKAYDIKRRENVAIKEMIKQSNLDEELLAQLRTQFKREAQALQKISHTHLAKVHNYFIENGNSYLVMEFVEGNDLLEIIKHVIEKKPDRNGAIPEKYVKWWSLKLIDAISYCHKNGIVHRDIKPANIIIRHETKQPVLVDFGLVKLFNPDDITKNAVTVHGMGTLPYMAPEQYTGNTPSEPTLTALINLKRNNINRKKRTQNLYPELAHTIDERADIYSFGCTLYHAITGITPPSATERSANRESLKPLRDFNISDQMADVITKAMSLDINDRYTHIEEMREAIVNKPQRNIPWKSISFLAVFFLGAFLVASNSLQEVFPTKDPDLSKTKTYLPSETVATTSTPSIKLTQTLIPSIRTLNPNTVVRKGPGPEYQTAFTIPGNTTANVIAHADSGQWYNIELADGKRGWVNADDIEVINPEKILPAATIPSTPLPTFTLPPTSTITTTKSPPTLTYTLTKAPSLTPVPSTLTYTPTETPSSTPVPPTLTYTPSSTPVPPSRTPTRTKTPKPPTITPSKTPSKTPTKKPTKTPRPIIQINNWYVDSNNNLYIVIDGNHKRYRLYVRRDGAVFGDAPHYTYYQIYNTSWPKTLLIVVDVNPNTIYCAELKSDNGNTRYYIASYKTGRQNKPYTGSVYSTGSCPID